MYTLAYKAPPLFRDKEIEKEGPSDSADDSVQRLSQDKELSPIPQGDSGATLHLYMIVLLCP